MTIKELTQLLVVFNPDLDVNFVFNDEILSPTTRYTIKNDKSEIIITLE